MGASDEGFVDTRIKSTEARFDIDATAGSVRMDPTDKPWGDAFDLYSNI